ncbi:MAG: alpha/beta fold hydrolase [Campylobacterota bacterium]
MAVKFVPYKGFEYKLSYSLHNPGGQKALLFLHGWGSNKEVMQQAFGTCFAHYTHIYLDLPGFGRSNHGPALNTADYAAITKAFLQQFNYEFKAVFGHSFGGKVAVLLAPKNIVLLSSAGVIEPKAFRIKAKIALFKLLKPLGFAKLRRFFASKDAAGMDEAMYQTFKNVVDEDFTAAFAACTSKTLICWGSEDKATSLQSGRKIGDLIQDSRFCQMPGDHYFFLRRASEIEKEFHAFLE